MVPISHLTASHQTMVCIVLKRYSPRWNQCLVHSSSEFAILHTFFICSFSWNFHFWPLHVFHLELQVFFVISVGNQYFLVKIINLSVGQNMHLMLVSCEFLFYTVLYNMEEASHQNQAKWHWHEFSKLCWLT